MTFVLFVLLWNLALLWAFEVVNWITMIQKVRRWYGYDVTAPALLVENYRGDVTAKLFGGRLQVWLRSGGGGYMPPTIRGSPHRKGVYFYVGKGVALRCILGAESQGARVRLIVGKLIAEMIMRQRRGDDILMVWWGRRFREWALRPKRYITGATR